MRLDNLDISHIENYHTDSEWLDLFRLILSNLSSCFIIVEAESLFQAFRHDPPWVERFLGLFQQLVDSSPAAIPIKVLAVSYGASLSTVANLPGGSRRIISSLQQTPQLPLRLRRPLGRFRRAKLDLKSLRPILDN